MYTFLINSLKKNMKKYTLLLLLTFVIGFSPVSALAAAWKPTPPEGFTPITWVGANGVASFMRAPENAGYIDYVTIIHLPSTQVKLMSSDIPRMITSPAVEPFPLETAQNWLFTRSIVEKLKAANPEVRFVWDMPFFSVSGDTTNLSFALKSTDAMGPYITSGYRLPSDIAAPRRMLIVDNSAGTGKIVDFNESVFIAEGDQAVEGFAPFAIPSVASVQTARLFVGVRGEGKELVVYCSRSASHEEASNALMAAGVPLENQLQADGGGSTACGYNLPGQYFVEPGRALPHIMGATPVVFRGTITIDELNVRSGASTNSSVVRKLALGTPITAYEEKNGWFRIAVGEWISAKYVKKLVVFPYSASVSIDELNVRSGAGTNFPAVRRLPIGTTVNVLEEKNGWARISLDEWVSAKYIK